MFLAGDGKPGPDHAVVIADLAKFCRAHSSTAIVSPMSKTIDPIAMAMAEGRREVWNRIQGHLYLSDEVLLKHIEITGESSPQ